MLEAPPNRPPPPVLAVKENPPPAGFEAAGVLKLNPPDAAPKPPEAAGGAAAPKGLEAGAPNADGAEEPPKGDAPKAGVLDAPKRLPELGELKAVPPKAGVEEAPKAGVLLAPKADPLLAPKPKGALEAGAEAPNRPPPAAGALAPKPPNAGVLAGGVLPKPPKAELVLPKAGVELAPKGAAALCAPNTLPVALAPKPLLLLAAAPPNPKPPGLVDAAGVPKPAGAAVPFLMPAA